MGDRWLMTTCSVSPERHSTTLHSSVDAVNWTFEGIVLDHQNKDMLIFEGLIDGQYWAQTRPLGQLFFAYPPGSPWHAGPVETILSRYPAVRSLAVFAVPDDPVGDRVMVALELSDGTAFDPRDFTRGGRRS